MNEIYCECKNKGRNLVLIIENKSLCSKCLRLWNEEKYLKVLKGGIKENGTDGDFKRR
jgi:hypothetical protein